MKEMNIEMYMIKDSMWEVRDRLDNVLKKSDDDYFIYMRGVKFKNGNKITGRYLGDIKGSNKTIIDKYCKPIVAKDGGFYVDGKKIRDARMIAVNNKKELILIVANS